MNMSNEATSHLEKWIDRTLARLTGQKNAPLIGIDITTTSVKLVELSMATNGTIALDRCMSEPLPRGVSADGNIDDIEAITTTIRRILTKSGVKIKRVALGLPSSSVITKKITLLANGSEESLEVQVESEASQYLPFSLDEVSLDFSIIGPSSQPDEVEVLLAAARREKVEDRLAVIESCGLKAVIMDIDSYAARLATFRLISHMPNQGKDKIVALVEIGAKVTRVAILLNGQTIYEREQAFGGYHLTQEIMRQYDLSFEEAEIKKRGKDLPEGYEQDVLQPFIENVALEVMRIIQFFFTATQYKYIDHVYLGGGCVVLPGLLDMVATHAKVPTELVQPFEGMHISPGVKLPSVESDMPGFLVACGLALRRFDSD